MRLFLFIFLIQFYLLQAYASSAEQQFLVENKLKRGQIISLFSQSTMPEEKEALKIELQTLQMQIAQQLHASVVTSTEGISRAQSSTLVGLDFEVSVCDTEVISKSLSLIEQVYQPSPPVNKFWEGVVLLQRELVHINVWLDKLNEFSHSQSGQISAPDADEMFNLLNDGSPVNILESLKRLEQFLESERITLILKYEGAQNIVLEVYSQLHSIIENIELALRNEKTPELALLEITKIVNSEIKLSSYKEKVDFLLRLILEDIIFRDNYKNKEDIGVLAAVDNINYQLFNRKSGSINELRKVIAESKITSDVLINSNLSCQMKAISVQNNIYQSRESMSIDSPVFEFIDAGESSGRSTIAPILKSWTTYINDDCLQLTQWQTNHNFWCNSDYQEGCERISASLCKPVY